jgi:hypothetical protein
MVSDKRIVEVRRTRTETERVRKKGLGVGTWWREGLPVIQEG